MYTIFKQSEWNAFRSGKKGVIIILGYDYIPNVVRLLYFQIFWFPAAGKSWVVFSWNALAIKFLSFQLSASSVLHRCPWLGFFHNVNTRLKSKYIYRRSDRVLERNSLLYNVVYFCFVCWGFFLSLFYRIACSILRLIISTGCFYGKY